MKNTHLFLMAFVMLVSSCSKEDAVTTPVTPPQNKVDLKKGLVAWYKFDGNLADSSGNANDAGNSGRGDLIYGNDRNGQARGSVTLDGVDDILVANDKGKLATANVTVSAYFRTNSDKVQNLVCKRNAYFATTPEEFGGLAWSINARKNNTLHFAVISPVNASCGTPRGIDLGDLVYSLQPINLQTWYHVVCVFSEGSQRVYINGRLMSATTRGFASLRQCTGGQLVIGGYVDDEPTAFSGQIDDLRVYDRLLNEQEIAELAKGF